MAKLKEKEFKLGGLWAMIIIIIWSISLGEMHANHRERKTILLESELERFQGEVRSTIKTYEKFADYIYNEIDQDEEIKAIIYEANRAGEKEKQELRQRLYNKMSEKYVELQKFKFRQLHFHLPDTESFLRVHTPGKYGDKLANNRESVRLVNENKTKISGFEEGKIFNGFRNVYPLEYKSSHIGSVEISMSSVSIIEILSELDENKDFYFIIDKEVVEKNLFEDKLSNYKDSDIFDDYYADKEVDESALNYNTVTPASKDLFFENIEKEYGEKLAKKESFSLVSKFKNKFYTVNFLSIENFKQKPTAYLISVAEISGYVEFMKDMYKEIILVTILAFFIILFALMLAFYQNKLKKNAERDCLTNIYNRNKFYEMANKKIKEAKEKKGEISILFMDIDCFKEINDTHGHEWGDEVLKELVREVSENIRQEDIFARWGGEEFILLLPNTKKKNGLIVAEKIRKLIQDAPSKELKDVTISIGLSVMGPDNYDINHAISLADKAMYKAKNNGRNQICCK